MTLIYVSLRVFFSFFIFFFLFSFLFLWRSACVASNPFVSIVIFRNGTGMKKVAWGSLGAVDEKGSGMSVIQSILFYVCFFIIVYNKIL